MRILTLILLGLTAIARTTAQDTETYRFTLDEAIAFALENNYKAINAGREVLDARKQKWETIASGLPQISGAVSYQNQLIQQVVQLPGEIAGGDPGTFVAVVFGQPQQMNAAATLRQQIFDGSYIVGVQATKAFLSYSANNLEKTEQEVIKAVVESYGNVLLSREGVEILEKNRAALEKNLFETTKIFENGLGDEESVEQLQITLSSIENELKNAHRLKDISLQILNLVLGLELEAPTELQEDLDALAQEKIDRMLLDNNLDIDKNTDYKLAKNLTEQRYFEWKLARSRALPTLNAFASYGALSFGEDFTFFDSGQEWFEFSAIGLDLNIPIFSSLGRSASTQRAKIALEQAETQLSEAEAQIRLQLENAKSNYILAIEQYGTSKKNLALAERIEKKNETKYFEGLATSFELRQAQTQLYDAQQQYLQSMVQVINRKTDLEIILNEKS
ncbi:TolC family protein [Maribacter sp. 2307ULW6-5]|uniref:TolC family protein n=1 Tax=Maribacter sp. 2307ULW6-5 TaxID=3386275 RepID=UPI0039BD14EC